MVPSGAGIRPAGTGSRRRTSAPGRSEPPQDGFRQGRGEARLRDNRIAPSFKGLAGLGSAPLLHKATVWDQRAPPGPPAPPRDRDRGQGTVRRDQVPDRETERWVLQSSEQTLEVQPQHTEHQPGNDRAGMALELGQSQRIPGDRQGTGITLGSVLSHAE